MRISKLPLSSWGNNSSSVTCFGVQLVVLAMSYQSIRFNTAISVSSLIFIRPGGPAHPVQPIKKDCGIGVCFAQPCCELVKKVHGAIPRYNGVPRLHCSPQASPWGLLLGGDELERYSEELKNGALELVTEQDPPVAGVAARLGMWRHSR